MERTGDRLGGSPSVSSLAPNPARRQSQGMRNKHLVLAERIELEAALRAGDTQAWIAARLGRAAGTIVSDRASTGSGEERKQVEW